MFLHDVCVEGGMIVRFEMEFSFTRLNFRPKFIGFFGIFEKLMLKIVESFGFLSQEKIEI